MTQLQDSQYSGISWHQDLADSTFLKGTVTSAGVGEGFSAFDTRALSPTIFLLTTSHTFLFCSSHIGGAFLGSLIVFSVTDAMGTRREMLFAAVLFACGAVVEALAASASLSAGAGKSVLLLGRWTYGIGCGFATHGKPRGYLGVEAFVAPPPLKIGNLCVAFRHALIPLPPTHCLDPPLPPFLF